MRGVTDRHAANGPATQRMPFLVRSCCTTLAACALAERCRRNVIATTATAPERASDEGLIALTRNEIRRLFTALSGCLQLAKAHVQHTLHWSRWRRRHQARARDYHYRRQEALLA